jgi:riboflavin kinase/FMN adenylyltransferase
MKNKKSCVTIGTFDGVHKGHAALIDKTAENARLSGCTSIAVVLEKPVRSVNGIISTYEEKIELIKRRGIDEIFVIEVPSAVLSLNAGDFFDSFLIGVLNAGEIVCGKDFAFGKDRKGDVVWLKNKAKTNGVKITVAKPFKIASRIVSSSRIRDLIKKGDVKNANLLLGRNYSFCGAPFCDRGEGTKLGFPTVNLKVDSAKLLPCGVYVSVISRGKNLFPALTSIGTRPTFNAGSKVVPETHILDFSGKWGKTKSCVSLLKKIRDEKKFDSVESLKEEIKKDVKKAADFFGLTV